MEIDVGYTPTFLKFNHDDEEKGKTKFFNLGTRFYVKQWMQNLELSKTKGYYISAKDFGYPDENNVIFPDLKVFKIGGSTSYIFNPDFSFRAIFKQTEWQQKSSGSFVPTLSYYYTDFKNEGMGKDQYVDVATGPSYFYNWIIANKFLVSAGAFGGIGYSHVRSSGFTDGTASSKSDGLNYRTEFTVAIGYNTPKFFTGVNVSINSFYHNVETDFRVDDQQQFFEFHLGYRFGSPKKLERKMDSLQKKVGM